MQDHHNTYSSGILCLHCPKMFCRTWWSGPVTLMLRNCGTKGGTLWLCSAPSTAGMTLAVIDPADGVVHELQTPYASYGALSVKQARPWPRRHPQCRRLRGRPTWRPQTYERSFLG